ncbi:AraC family transcriptional regulator [Thiomonas sp. FB-Cd]|uniref:AraC family transcriptional regulator n=1 Tax=Thiomonas sp. FB-Cd TaxID=1158292 RepID=UPI0006909957|nr:AraC family transcriptional regulator [Thiomonas sp. FB-Cd]
MNTSSWTGLPRDGKLEQVVIAVNCLEPVFDALVDAVIFLKDAEARYLFVNKTFMDRCMVRSKDHVYGRLAQDIFPQRFGAAYTTQDRAVLASGDEITNQLELHFYTGRRSGWCLTSKYCIVEEGRRVALMGISRDLKAPEQNHPAYERVAAVAAHIQQHYAHSLQLHSLATMANMSIAQLERYFKIIFNLSPRQLLLKARLEAARKLLPGELNLTQIASQCGYADHSAFSRQFKTLIGISPRSYRASLRMMVQKDPMCQDGRN